MSAPTDNTRADQMSSSSYKDSISSESMSGSQISKNDNATAVVDPITPDPVTQNIDVEKQNREPTSEDLDGKADPNIVDFDGPDDPYKPINWPLRSKKLPMLACLSFMTLITPLASSMFAPGVLQVLEEFHSTSKIYESLVVSIYILGYALGPMILAPLSEIYGRMVIYNATNTLFVIFTICCAVSKSLPMLTAFRFFAGFSGSAPITLGGGTIGDLFMQEQRGRAIAIWSMGPMLGPVIGPIAGGFLTEKAGWRWVFWLITILSGLLTIAYIFFVHESYSLVLLQRKAKKLRKETGNPNLRAKGDHGEHISSLVLRSIRRPLELLFFSPIVLALSLYAAVSYGYLYLFFTTLPSVFIGTYHFTSGTVGLTYLGIGLGMFASMIINGILSDKILKSKAAKADGELKPEYRLPLMIPGALLMPIGLLMYGWTAQYAVQWMVPIIGTALFGFSLISTMIPVSQYLIDAYIYHAASALAANTILRSILGALLPLAGPSMFSKLGLGWGNSLLGFMALALIFIPFALIRYGERLRKSANFKRDL